MQIIQRRKINISLEHASNILVCIIMVQETHFENIENSRSAEPLAIYGRR